MAWLNLGEIEQCVIWGQVLNSDMKLAFLQHVQGPS